MEIFTSIQCRVIFMRFLFFFGIITARIIRKLLKLVEIGALQYNGTDEVQTEKFERFQRLRANNIEIYNSSRIRLAVILQTS